MANVKCGAIWKFPNSAMPPSVFLTYDALAPVGGDLCDTTGDLLRAPRYKATSAGTLSTAAKTISHICVQGVSEIQALNNEGLTARTGTTPGILQIGSQGKARTSDLTGARKAFVPVMPGLEWVMTCSAAPTVGTQYGITRVAAGNYTVLVSDTTNAVVEVTGVYQPDFETNGSSARNYWVKAVLPGGYM